MRKKPCVKITRVNRLREGAVTKIAQACLNKGRARAEDAVPATADSEAKPTAATTSATTATTTETTTKGRIIEGPPHKEGGRPSAARPLCVSIVLHVVVVSVVVAVVADVVAAVGFASLSAVAGATSSGLALPLNTSAPVSVLRQGEYGKDLGIL